MYPICSRFAICSFRLTPVSRDRLRIRSHSPLKTRGDQLVLALAFALRGTRLRGRTGVLSEEDRYAIAELVVASLRAHGDPWRLDDDLPPFFHGPPTQGYR
jgi:hypothetical protein